VIIIWSTTPLAIKWSSEGPGFLFAITARMLMGTLLCLLLLKLLRVVLPWDVQARRAYAAVALAIYGAMLCTYWGAQFVPSGLVSVLYGLSPVVTGIFAGLWLEERGLTRVKLTGMLTGLLGLALVYRSGLQLGASSAYGILAIFVAVNLQVLSTVLVKRIGAVIPALALTAGGLLLALPLYLITWWIFDGVLPHTLPTRAAWSILYLGAFGSVMGFVLYYYVLTKLDTGRIALITLITPVTALILGHTINAERIGADILVGALLILSGLALHQWEDLMHRRRLAADTTAASMVVGAPTALPVEEGDAPR
jgi:drug/metabolite transporter (DMT)-like permease